MTKTLNDEQVATLKALRREVDDLQDLLHKTYGVPPDAGVRLHRAREKLRAYTSNLRGEGFNI